MKFEKITDSKIKILFTLEDMNLNNISAKSFLSNNSISQKILQDVLIEAEKQVGFQADDSKLLVEAIMSTDGGLIFTITKLSNYLKDDNSCDMIFEFDDFDNFLAFCTYLEDINDFNYLNVFSYNNMYYLHIVFFDNILYDYFYNILIEFAKPISSTTFDGILNEYGKLILDKNTIKDFIKCYI